jgi:hypothetical protein
MIWLSIGTINNKQVPGNGVDNRSERESDSKRVVFMNSHSEEPGDLGHQNAPRSTRGGTKLKIIKPLGGKVFQKMNINKISFGFLKTENIRPTLSNFVFQQALFVLII